MTWIDGESLSGLARALQNHMARAWRRHEPEAPPLTFTGARNLKSSRDLEHASPTLQAVAWIRNPDVFFELVDPRVDLGGVEITSHSPDGSNADKRYPYLWASRQHELDAFVVCPYRKTRTQGANNQLPFRHAHRNRAFVESWNAADTRSYLTQILPLTDLQSGIEQLPRSISSAMWNSAKLGEFFALRIAQRTLADQAPINRLTELRVSLLRLIEACEANTRYTAPSTVALHTPAHDSLHVV